MKRAAVCIGVDRAGKLTPLQAAAKGAREFEQWAIAQGCETRLLVDEDDVRVKVSAVCDAVQGFVDSGAYDQLIVYFSGHGILTAPGAEFWLLSGAPSNSSEAVNVCRSIEDARNSGIPHIVFVSDACRSSAKGPLSGILGTSIFPNLDFMQQRAEVDTFYATCPGDPAYEVSSKNAAESYCGIFTECLLDSIQNPQSNIVELVSTTGQSVITSRKLKPILIEKVPVRAAAADIKLRQIPEVRVETELPRFFSLVDLSAVSPSFPPTTMPVSSVQAEFDALKTAYFTRGPSLGEYQDVYSYAISPHVDVDTDMPQPYSHQVDPRKEVRNLIKKQGKSGFETGTGFSIYGDVPIETHSRQWESEPAFCDYDCGKVWHIRLTERGYASRSEHSALVIQFLSGIGAYLPVLSGFICTVVVRKKRLVSVNYVPSTQNWRHDEYRQRAGELERMKAFAAVASRNGRFNVEDESATNLADRIRQGKSLDPTLGLYAAYAYAQVGQYSDVESVLNYMEDDEVPVPFDVVMLASRYREHRDFPRTAYSPLIPMLSQGWAHLMPGDPLHLPLHEKLRPHIIPALWTTITRAGTKILIKYLGV